MIRAASAAAAASASASVAAAPHESLAGSHGVGRPPLFLVREGEPSYDTSCAEPATPAEHATPSELDAIEELGDEIATLAAHIHAATHRLLVMLGEFDRRRGWELGGHRSCAHWLAFRAGIDLGAAREKVRTARALTSLPETGASMARGELSFSQVRALTRVATPENEGDLLDLARGTTVAQLERMVRGFRRGSRRDEAAWERANHESRTLSVFPDEEGMYVVRGRIVPEVAAVLMRAIEASGDALYREGGCAVRGSDVGPGTRWGCWRSGPWRLASPRRRTHRSAGVVPLATRWCCTWTPRDWPQTARAATANWRTAHAFQVKRVAGSPATRAWWKSPTLPMAPCSMWAAGRARSRLRSAAPWRSATADAAFRAADPASPTRTT